jgi:hypothetical protein
MHEILKLEVGHVFFIHPYIKLTVSWEGTHPEFPHPQMGTATGWSHNILPTFLVDKNRRISTEDILFIGNINLCEPSCMLPIIFLCVKIEIEANEACDSSSTRLSNQPPWLDQHSQAIASIKCVPIKDVNIFQAARIKQDFHTKYNVRFEELRVYILFPKWPISAYSGYPEMWILRYPAHRYRAVPSPGFETKTIRLRVRRSNHSATTLHAFRLRHEHTTHPLVTLLGSTQALVFKASDHSSTIA